MSFAAPYIASPVQLHVLHISKAGTGVTHLYFLRYLTASYVAGDPRDFLTAKSLIRLLLFVFPDIKHVQHSE